MKFLSKFYIGIVFFLLYIPIAVLIIFSFNEAGSLAEFSGFSFIWYEELFNDEEALTALKNSLLLANAYEENGLPFTLHIFGKGPHGGSIATKAVYNEQDYPIMQKRFSTDFTLWPTLALNWLKDLGFDSEN